MQWLARLLTLLHPPPKPASLQKLRETDAAISQVERKAEQHRALLEARSRLWRRKGPLG